ncbi:MAG: FAD-binding domain-containing protein [Saonia sp.]
MMALFDNEFELFPSKFNEILQRVQRVDPVKYGRSRNFIDGAVTYLSPYISRGVISTKFILEYVLNKGYKPIAIEKFIQELAWRDYWQNVWIAKQDTIDTDLKKPQEEVENYGIPDAILNATTAIEAIDKAIMDFYKTGYIHNHVRMYLSSIACNIGGSHWNYPARWMYYYLLDADWASNALSWQWVVGSNSTKKYYANQANINKYCYTHQEHTFLDVSYEKLKTLAVPEKLGTIVRPNLETPLPPKKSIQVRPELPTLIYNFYNLDPQWKKEILANRIILLEPSLFKKYPISQKSIDFVLALKENIENAQVYVGAFNELVNEYRLKEIYYKEHPLNGHYEGIAESRDWMFTVQGYYSSFFGFWKKCKKELNY